MNNDSTDERVNAIRERRAKITQGKWRSWLNPFGDLSGFTVSGNKSQGVAMIVGHAGQDCGSDAEFIANAPDDIDFLLTEVARLEGEVEGVCAFFGATMKDNGDLSINMPKYHAAHVCKDHQWLPKEQRIFEERCPVCLNDEVASLRSQLAEAKQELLERGAELGKADNDIVGLREQFELLDDPDGLYSETKSRIERKTWDAAIREVRKLMNADFDRIEGAALRAAITALEAARSQGKGVNETVR